MSSRKCWLKTCKFPLFPSITHQNSFVAIKFKSNSFCSHQVPKNSHQIPLVPISNVSISFCSHQVPKQFPSNSSCSCQVSIKFLLFLSSFHQIPFVPTAMEDRQVSMKVNDETHETLRLSAKQSANCPHGTFFLCLLPCFF